MYLAQYYGGSNIYQIADAWFADYVVWNRHASDINKARDVVSLIFDTSLQARVSRPSDGNKSTSVLVEDTGIKQRIVPQSGWDYVDSETISIDSAQYTPSAIYSFTYNILITDSSRIVSILAEMRNSADGITMSSWTPFAVNDKIDPTHLYQQLRLTLSNVQYTSDIRIHSMTVKGLILGGVEPTP